MRAIGRFDFTHIAPSQGRGSLVLPLMLLVST